MAANGGDLQRVEQEIVSSQKLACNIGNLSKTRSDVTGSRLRLKDGERLYPKSWSGNTPLGSLRASSLHGWGTLIQRGWGNLSAEHERDAQSD